MTQTEISSVRSVWTAADEAKLIELEQRKERIMQEARLPLVEIINRGRNSDVFQDRGDITSFLIEHADDLIRALQPFAKETP